MKADVSGAKLTHPPHARLAFRVGVIGHRPDRLPDDPAARAAIRETIATVLDEVRIAVSSFRKSAEAAKFYSDDPPALRAISSLAEGADRMFADEALAAGYELCCVMPFHKAEFEADFREGNAFEENSVQRFERILDAANASGRLATFELDGDRSRESNAYGMAGQVVLNQSDLLIAVWDGGGAAGAGGTVDTLGKALDFRMPVFWIDSKTPYGWHLLRDRAALPCLDEPSPCIAAPSPATDREERRQQIADAITPIVIAEIGLPREPVRSPNR